MKYLLRCLISYFNGHLMKDLIGDLANDLARDFVILTEI